MLNREFRCVFYSDTYARANNEGHNHHRKHLQAELIFNAFISAFILLQQKNHLVVKNSSSNDYSNGFYLLISIDAIAII